MSLSPDGKIFGSPDKGFGQCTALECTRYADSADGFCHVHRHIRKYDGEKTSMMQVALAMRALNGNVPMVTWPYPRLHAMAGPLVQGQLTVVVANSGGGKTTFAFDVTRRWVERGVGVTVLPLETVPQEWRMGLAATMVGILPGDAWEIIHRAKGGDVNAFAQVKLLEGALVAQADGDWLKHFHCAEDSDVTVKGLDRAMGVAKDMGHLILLVDHIDHVGSDRDEITGRKASGIEMHHEVNDAVLKLAKIHRLHVVAMSQAKMGIGSADNRLLQYRRLSRDDIAYPSKKVHNASQILGLSRPLRYGLSGQTRKLARDGVISVQEALAPDRMDVNAIKLRHRGKNEGESIQLRFSGAQLHDLSASEVEHDVALALIDQGGK